MIQRNAISKMAHLDETPLILRLPRAEMRPDPDQPRKKRNREKLEGLAQTMLVKQLQPILVRQVDGEDGYMIVVGEGRWLAAGINEELTQQVQYLDSILVDETNAGKIRSMQLIENLQREDMNELDIANGYRELIELGECPNGKAVAERMGVSAATVSVFLKVLDAPEPIKQLVANGITKIDTARTLMMLADINKARADSLVQEAIDTNVLKRSSVRDAYADEKARAENAAAAAEAVHEAAQAGASIGTTAGVQQESADTPLSSGQDPANKADSADDNVQPVAATSTVQEPQHKAGEAAQHNVEGVDKGNVVKAPVAPLKGSPQHAPEVPKQPAAPTTAQAALASSESTSPTEQSAGMEAAPEGPADSPLVVAEKFDVLVSIRSGTPDEERFISLDVEFGNARLASHIVHRESSRAWVQFGTSKEREQLQAFNCSDLEIVKVIQRV